MGRSEYTFFPKSHTDGQQVYQKMLNITSSTYPKKMKILTWKNICTFSAALFTITKIWKQLKCPSMDEQIMELWHIYSMEYYSAIKKNEILSFATTSLDLEGIMLGEINQTEKDNTVWSFLQMKSLGEKKKVYRYREEIGGSQRCVGWYFFKKIINSLHVNINNIIWQNLFSKTN